MLELNSCVSLNGKGGFSFWKCAAEKREKILLPLWLVAKNSRFFCLDFKKQARILDLIENKHSFLEAIQNSCQGSNGHFHGINPNRKPNL